MDESSKKRAVDGFAHRGPADYMMFMVFPNSMQLLSKLKEQGYGGTIRYDRETIEKYGMVELEIDKPLDRIDLRMFVEMGFIELRLLTTTAKE